MQEARIKDKENPIGDLSFLQDAYLHPSIVEAPKGSDSDDDPDTVRNGTAPGGHDPTHKRTEDSASVTEPSNKGPSFRSRTSPTSSSRGFHDAGSNLSTPALSRESSHASSLPKEEIGFGSARSSPYRAAVDGERGAHVGEIDWAKRRHFLEAGSPEKEKKKEGPEEWSDVPQREDQGDRGREERESGASFAGTVQAPLGHVEP